jgi:transcriptional regulator with XRE-family HTH domain
MTREEFCSKLSECRKNSNVKMIDICASMDVMPAVIYRLESGKYGFTVDSILAFIKATKHQMIFEIPTSQKPYKISSIKDVSNALKNIRLNFDLSKRDLSIKSGITQRTIISIENGTKNIYIDTVIKYLNSFNATIKIK